MRKLAGESRYIPNLHFDLREVQLREVMTTLEKFEGAHHTRMNWMGPYELAQNHLSIHALDLLSVLGHCRRSPESEMELFRLRRSAIEQLTSRRERTFDAVKAHNLNLWFESYDKLWLGDYADKDLSQRQLQPNCIDLIP